MRDKNTLIVGCWRGMMLRYDLKAKTYKTFTAITLGDITDLLSIDNNTFAFSLEDTIIIWKY